MRLNLQSRAGRWVGFVTAGALAVLVFCVIRSARLASAQAQQAAAPAAAAQPRPAPVNDLVAVVNGERISRQELAQECIRRYGKEVLEGTINRQLIQQACDQHKIKISEQEVTAEVNRLAERFKLDPQRWLQLLEQERGFSPEEYRREVIWPMLAMRQLTAARVQVSEQEVQQAFQSEYGPRVRVRIINSSSQEKAAELHAQAVANPIDFPNLAKKAEDPGIASAQGIVPPIRRHVGDKNFEDAVFKLKVGEISPILKVANEYYIVKCEGHLPDTKITSNDLPAVKAQLIERLKEQKLRTVAGDMFKELQTAAQVVTIHGNPEQEKKYPGVAAFVNQKPINMLQLGEECIARHGRDTLEGEVNRKLLQQELLRNQKTVTDADLQAEVARAAETYGFFTKDNKPDVKRWLAEVTQHDNATVELYIRDAVWPSVALKKIIGDVQVTEDDLTKGYQANYGEMIEVLAIVLQDQRQAQKVWDFARNNPTDVFFGELAETYSTEPVSRANKGKVPPIRKFSGQGKIEEEAFKLQPGELSAIIETGNQQIILRCVGRTVPKKVAFAEVRDELYKDIHEQKLRVTMTKKFDELKESAQVDNFIAQTTQAGKRGVLSQIPAAANMPRANPTAGPANTAAQGVPPTASRNIPAKPASATQPLRK